MFANLNIHKIVSVTTETNYLPDTNKHVLHIRFRDIDGHETTVSAYGDTAEDVAVKEAD